MFSEVVKKKRKKLKVSREKFGAALGVSAVTVWRWERGLYKPKADALGYWVNHINNLKF